MNKNGGGLVSMLIAALAGGGGSYFIQEKAGHADPVSQQRLGSALDATSPCAFTTAQARGFRLVGPVVYSEPACATPRLQPLHGSLASMVAGLKASGGLTSASVYVRDLLRGDWTSIGGGDMYDPGSMMKVPVLLTYLAMADEIPGMLEKKLVCEASDVLAPAQSILPGVQAVPNTTYSVRELLDMMIVHSDNRATAVLLRHVPSGRFVRTFRELGLEAPVQHGSTYLMSAGDFSVFMKALYNSTLLSPMRSEYALGLMARSSYAEGILKGLPPGTEAAHKFGEAAGAQGAELHEAAIVYAESGPYVVTIMTRGPRPDPLPGVIAGMSSLVHQYMSRKS